jgi:hypothetical protein
MPRNGNYAYISNTTLGPAIVPAAPLKIDRFPGNSAVAGRSRGRLTSTHCSIGRRGHNNWNSKVPQVRFANYCTLHDRVPAFRPLVL